MNDDETPETPPSSDGLCHPSGRPIEVIFNDSEDEIVDPFSIITGANLRPENERFKAPAKEEVDRDNQP
jgi:hypothetical protein